MSVRSALAPKRKRAGVSQAVRIVVLAPREFEDRWLWRLLFGPFADSLPNFRHVDTAGKPIGSQHFVSARIDGVRYGPDGPVLNSGGMQIPFATVLEVTD